MNYLAIAQSVLASLSFNQEHSMSDVKPVQRKSQSDDERIAEIAWARMKLIHQEQSSDGNSILFL